MLAQLKEEHPDLYFISLTIEEKDDEAKVSQWLKKAGAESLKAGKSSDTAKSKLHKFAGLEGIAIGFGLRHGERLPGWLSVFRFWP